MILDANILLYAANSSSPRHAAAQEWISSALNGDRRVGFPLATLWAFVRIATHPRVFDTALTPDQAWGVVDDWLDAEVAWVPEPGSRHLGILRDLMTRHDVRRDLVSDAVLAAIALEHGVPVVSADADFARFDEVSWINPFAR
jgi:hypothetical protein